MNDDRIVNWADYGEHIPLKCKKCGGMFSTKNILRIGARSLFNSFNKDEIEQSHKCDELGHTIEDLEPCEEAYRKEKNSGKA